MNSYLKFLSRNKLYTAVMAVGLIVSMAFALLIGNYVLMQYHVVKENPDHDRIYAVGTETYISDSWWDKDEYLAKIPEVEAATRFGFSTYGTKAIKVNGSTFAPVIASVDKAFFDIFPYYTLVEGSLDEFTLPDKCLVSESFANKICKAGQSAVGKRLEADSWPDGKEIIGVFKDFENTLVPENIEGLFCAEQSSMASMTPFTSIGSYITLVRVMEGTDRAELQEKVQAINSQNYIWQANWCVYNLEELYFNDKQDFFNSGNKGTLRTLVVVVLLLLVCAIFNYINLNMALSGKRAKEMATRRLLGASQQSILWKYIAESVAFTLVCFGLAFLLAKALLPMMDGLLTGSAEKDRTIHLTLGVSWKNILMYLVAAVCIGALAGVVPALFASRFAPIDVVKGNFRLRNKLVFSKVFIVFQNAVALVLIAMALLMETQMRHMLNRPLNARSENLYCIDNQTVTRGAEAGPLVSALEALPQVLSVGFGNGIPGSCRMTLGLMGVPGSDEDEDKVVHVETLLADTTYFRLLGLHPVEIKNAGSPFGAVWMSQSTAAAIQLDTTTYNYAENFNINGANGEYVAGVYEDIPTRVASSEELNANSAIVVDKLEDLIYPNTILVETVDESKATGRAIMSVFKDYCEETQGIYVEQSHGFMKDQLASMLDPTRKGMRLLEIFALLAVMISLLGLVAMSTYFSDESTKEIAIRKVFGSDSSTETLRSVRSYMLMIGLSCLIGLPLAVYFAHGYLQSFAYRISGYWWVFVLATIILLLIALASIYLQIHRAATTNPASELKKD